MTLLLEQVYRNEIYDTICNGETYSFEGNIYTESGQYTVSYPTSHGCDSALVVNLYVRDVPTPTIQNEVCADDKHILIYCQPEVDYSIDYTLSFDNKAHEQGFTDMQGALRDTIISIPIPVKSGNAYVEPNRYNVVLSLHSDVCSKTYSYDLSFNILYPSSVVILKFNDVLAVLNENYNGGYTFSAYQWYADGQPIDGATLPYYYGNGSLSANYYQVSLTRTSDGMTILTCPIIPWKEMDINTPGEMVFPCSMKVYHSEGTFVTERRLDSPADIVDVECSLGSGVYILILSEPHYGSKVTKIMIR